MGGPAAGDDVIAAIAVEVRGQGILDAMPPSLTVMRSKTEDKFPAWDRRQRRQDIVHLVSPDCSGRAGR